MMQRLLTVAAAVGVVGWSVGVAAPAVFAAPAASSPTAAHAVRFEVNQGQTNGSVKFVARSSGVPVFLTADDAVFELVQPKDPKTAGPIAPAPPVAPKTTKPSRQAAHMPDASGGVDEPQDLVGAVVRFHLEGANPNPTVSGLDPLAGSTNYLIGNDPSKWHTGVKSYARVQYTSVYPGIDLIFHSGPNGDVEYDFVVSPGANPTAISIDVQGANSVAANGKGGLGVSSAGGQLTQQAPVIYQNVNGSRKAVSGGYTVHDGTHVGFSLGAHDASKPLVIDPLLVYSTFLGGSTGLGDVGQAIAADGAGNAYVTGYALSMADFPTTTGSFQPSDPGPGNPPTWASFVTKLAPDGKSLVYSTYLGGSGSGGFFTGDQAFGIGVDASGRAYVGGSTTSPDFPTTRNAIQRGFQSSSSSQRTGFFALLDAAGANLVYATYLGGDGGVFANGDHVNAIAVDSTGKAIIVGDTQSTNFPLTGDAAQTQTTCTVACRSFSDGGTTAGSTVYTSASADFNTFDAGQPITGDNLPPNTQIASVDSPTQIELSSPAGVTSGPGVLNFTISDFVRDEGSSFLAEIDPTKSGAASLTYSTLLGGTEGGRALGVAVDASGAAYVAATTGQSAIPATSGALQSSCVGPCRDYSDGTVGGGSLTTLTSATANFTQNDVGQPVYGPGLAVGTSIASVESSTSLTLDTAAPAAAATSFVIPFRGGESFVAKVNPSLGASAIVQETYLGLAATNAPAGVALDSEGDPYVVGTASTPGFPTTAGAFDVTQASSQSGFVAKLNADLSAFGYSTLLGSASNTSLRGIAVDGAGRAVVTGFSSDGTSYPLKDQFVAYGAFVNGVVTELNPAGSGLEYSSFLGGSFGSFAFGVAVDGAGTAYVTGNTTSDDFPTTPGAFQQVPASHFTRGDAFVVKIAPTAASAPIVTGISPSHGPLGGGTAVTVTGHGFTGGSLSLGGVHVPSFSVDSDTQISAVTPPHAVPPLGTTYAPGFTVSTGGGTSPDNPVDQFVYGAGQWTATGSLGAARSGASATLLPSGKVLVTGGADSSRNTLSSAELYDPLSGTWTATGSLIEPHQDQTATLLPSGKVLVVGGWTSSPSSQGATAAAEIYDPAATGCGTGITGCWSAAASMPAARIEHTATLLPSGKVLIAGGSPSSVGSFPWSVNTAYEYDPAADSWATVGSMTSAHALHTATLLTNGKVLVAGGVDGTNHATSVAELFDPAATGCGTGITGCWTTTGSLAQARLAATATLLPNGKVLTAGGGTFSVSATLTTTEQYDPASGTWSLVGFEQHARGGHTATALPDGTILLAGGVFNLFGGGPESSDEIVNPAQPTGTTAADPMLTARGLIDSNTGPSASFTATLLSSDVNTFKADPAVCGANCGKVLVMGGSNDNSAELYSPAPNVTGASSTQQYMLNGSDGSTWQPIDANKLSLSVTPAVDSTAVMVGNADLWTSVAGFNQDLGISVTPQGGSPALVAWKESGGAAGTFSPNAAGVQGSMALPAGTTYTVQLVWKTNKQMPSGDMIAAGAGSPGNFSPTTLTAALYPAGGTAFHSAVSTQQFMLNGSDGSTWQTQDSNGHTLPSWTVTPATATDALLSGNADLWTENAGFNQDVGIQVTPGCNGAASNIVAWKESGGSAGTFSPNAAFVQAVCPMTGGTQYTAQLVWKANQAMPSGNKIAAGAGNPGNFSPTSLFGVLEAGANATSAVSTHQYMQTSDGATWQHVDDAVFNPEVAPPGPCAAVITGNADLWTMNAGYNQDFGIEVNGTVIAWKESGGFAGTFSPNAAYVQALYPVTTTTPFTVTLVWKSNVAMASGTHIAIGAGPWPSGSATFSPTSLTVDLRC